MVFTLIVGTYGFFELLFIFFSATNMVHKNNTKPISLFPDIKELRSNNIPIKLLDIEKR
jgi:hypothetical protein